MEALTALLVIVGAIFSVMAKIKDDKRKQDGAARSAPRRVRHEPEEETPMAPADAPQIKSTSAPAASPAPVRQAFILEGEDPCHDYMLGHPEQPQPEAALQENPAAQELLRSMILSEALQRHAPKAYRRRT